MLVMYDTNLCLEELSKKASHWRGEFDQGLLEPWSRSRGAAAAFKPAFSFLPCVPYRATNDSTAQFQQIELEENLR